MTAVSGVAHAATYSSDAERRTQNREEALTKWRNANPNAAQRTTMRRDEKRPTLRDRTRNGARSVSGFTHRQAESVRHFGQRQDRRMNSRFGKRNSANDNGAGSAAHLERVEDGGVASPARVRGAGSN